MRKIAFILTAALLTIAAPTAAQSVPGGQTNTAPQPTIIQFTSDIPSISVEAAESQSVLATLMWHTVGVTGDHLLILEVFRGNDWQRLLTGVPASGSQAVRVEHPQSFSPPAYRLSILDATTQYRLIDRRTVVIEYFYSGALPSIVTFVAANQIVDINAIAQNRARVQVAWQVSNRPPTANLVFEQVFPDGRTLPVETPRASLWLPSGGSGMVQPFMPEGEEDNITLRLRLVDLRDGRVYAERLLEVAVGGMFGTITPTFTPSPTFTPNPDFGILGGFATPSG